MASVLLSTATSAASISNPLAAIGLNLASRAFTSLASGVLSGGGTTRHREGARLESLSVQSSTYGKMVPIVYGQARIAGNVIWSLPIKEVATTTTTSQGGKGGGATASSSSTDYSYFITLAIAICEGEVDEVQRVWADADQLDLSLGTYRFYKGNETQNPDPLIESYEGVGSTPAYRGLSYVVIEDFPLADYGNRIPNFTFEIKKKVLSPDIDGETVEEMIKDMIMIPGSGEFVYDTQIQEKSEGEDVNGSWVQRGDRRVLNMHNPHGDANALVALDQLEETCPNLEWIGVVVNWFGDNLDAGTCVIKPGVEFADGAADTSPETWSVSSYTRASARQITYVDGSPRYGGTPDDESLLRYLSEVKARGYKVFFYPMFLMDVANKPWRGRVSGSTTDVTDFFTKTNGYNDFIIHYTNLVKNHVDAFAIGSELIGLTSVNDGASTNRGFPAVDALVSLAASVKTSVGSGVKVTYAADWSEYHHADGGWYNLDPLWASSNIDFIGIDAYFPLTDAPQSEVGYDPASIKTGWMSGEGYDWYYTDAGRTTTANLSAEYAWKNISWWWSNSHTNPDSNVTAWTAQSKKIWFTEFGFPSVDGATNQPNVFYDPTSSESFFPYHSKGQIDFRAQRAGIAATLSQWKNSTMVEHAFLWTWDARPYPYWPDLTDVWADGPVWKSGHWLQGKLGLSSLGAIVENLCNRAGLSSNYIDVTRLDDQVEGFVISSPDSARDVIEQLMSAYFFDAVESDGALQFVPRGNASVVTISEDELLPVGEGGERLRIQRRQELELPAQVEVLYFNRLKNYQTGTRRASRQITESSDRLTLHLPLVFSDQRAEMVAAIALYHQWMARTHYQFELSMRYADLEPADVITVQANGASHVMRITNIHLGRPGKVQIDAVAEDGLTYDAYAQPDEDEVALTQAGAPVAQTQLAFLDIPALSTDSADAATLRFAAAGLASNWNGSVVYRSDDGGGRYNRLVSFSDACVMGTAVTALTDGQSCVFDEVSSVDVVLLGSGELAGASELAVLNGANLALIGEELIQFKDATELTTGKYRLSGLLRGRMGTEHHTASHSAGEQFVLLDGKLQKDVMPTGLIGLARDYKAVSVGSTLGASSLQSFTYQANALKPYAPVHIEGVRDGSGNLTLSWVRRTRVGGLWRDYADVPLSEESEAYDIDILNGNNVVRTIAVTSPSANYSATDQAVDFGSSQSSLSVVIYQLSSISGRGFGAAATV